MVQRLTYRKRHGYATKSNQTRVVKTPGKDPVLLSMGCLLVGCCEIVGFRFLWIIRAFLVEEQKIVKKVLKIQKAKEKQASKS
ncbi:hypothetical protein BHE74_00050921 [Ensete ventricosum]|nr:hypothetical protein GW17_00011752 [Ensete ventricosum]RWW43430.1 hypothetical protein BHE74_00050921 [Ensete ventricosum]RZS22907.1 hypothetical protein BHM03_00055741 [Ensete ventricosum]